MLLVPKCDLHIHLGGSFPLSYLKEIAEPTDFSALTVFLNQIALKEGTDYHIAFGAFALVAKIVNNLEKVENGTVALCRQMAADGVVYVELRTGLKDFGSGYEAYLNSVMSGVDRGCAGSSLRVTLILSLKRNSSEFLARETLRLILKYRDWGVVGLDLSDDALLGDRQGLNSIIEEVHRNNIPIALHLGECAEETEEQQMTELETLRPARIGHGVFLCERAKQWIYERRLPIEMCLSSAVQAHMIQRPEDHPALQLALDGYPVIICTDDPLIFATDHVKETKMAMGLLRCSVKVIEDYNQAAIEKYSFLRKM